MSAIEDFVAERWAQPWKGRLSRFDEHEAPAKALYERYREWMEARGDKPLSHVDFGAAVQAVPGVGRARVPSGIVYSGITVETRRERAEAGVRRKLFDPAMAALTDHPGYAKWRAHHDEHARSFSFCEHEPKDPDVIALLAEVEAVIGAQLPAAVETEYGPWLRWQPGEPDPGVAIYRAEDEARRAEIIERIETMQAEDAAEAAKLREEYDAVYPVWQEAQDAIVPPVTRCTAMTCEDSTHWTKAETRTVKSVHPIDPTADPSGKGRGPKAIVQVTTGGGHIDWVNLPENAAYRESLAAARAIKLPLLVTPRPNPLRKEEYRRLRAELDRLDRDLATSAVSPATEEALTAY